AEMTDKALEAKIIKAFNKKVPEGQVKVVRIITPKWNIIRNKYTSVIISRNVDAVIGMIKDGKCVYQTNNFYQDYDGSSYQNDLYMDGEGYDVDIACGCLK